MSILFGASSSLPETLWSWLDSPVILYLSVLTRQRLPGNVPDAKALTSFVRGVFGERAVFESFISPRSVLGLRFAGRLLFAGGGGEVQLPPSRRMR